MSCGHCWHAPSVCTQWGAVLACPIATVAPLLPGAAHSIALLSVGYPFDTVKTRLQLRLNSSMWACTAELVREQGPVALYRGAVMPLATLLVKRPLEFAVFEQFNQSFKGEVYAPLLGGCVAGAISAFAGCPFSVVKIQMQATGKDVHATVYDAGLAVWRARGVRGFYRGLRASLYKDIPFAGLYLGTYGHLREALPELLPHLRSENGRPSASLSAAAGATSSIATWTLLQPLDTIKTVIQADVLRGKGTEQSWVHRVADIARAHGFRGLWAGWGPTALRSVPSSACAMVAYEWTRTACEAWQ